MRKHYLLTLVACLFAVAAWAADVSLVENFSNVGNVATNNYTWTAPDKADLCTWDIFQTARRVQDTIHTANQKQAIWMSVSSAGAAKVSTTNFEGGIKAVEFKYARYGSEKTAGRVLQLKVSVGTTEDNTPTFANNAMAVGNGASASHETYSHAFNSKSNGAQLSIENISAYTEALTSSGICRILVGDITITPYLLYKQKKAVVGLSQTGYVNNGLIDNTESEGTITYSSSAESVATVTSSGVIEPKAVGKTTITATWEGVTTSYELIVANMVAETFSGVTQTSSSGTKGTTWTGDVCTWSNKYARRGTSDLINNEQASWLTLDGTTRGFLRTTNLEGGLIGVAFDYAQFGAETGKVLIWEVSDGTSTGSVSRDGDLGANKNAPDAYSYVFENKQNAQLEILNASIMDDGTQPTNNARLLIHNIKIAPYLLYTIKEAALDTRNGILTYTNNSLVDNTAIEPGTNIVYSISSMEGLAGFNTATGEVTATDNTQGDYTITATWGEVSTSYVLAITSRNETSASFDGDAIVNLGLSDAAPTKTLSYTDGYDGTTSDITYSSNNSEVATVTNDGTVSLAGGVGQAIITAHLAQTANFKGTTASYIIQVTDNSANQLIETFSAVPNGNAASHTNKKWEGDLFDWHTTQNGGVRKNGDKFPSDNTEAHTGIWMGIPEATDTYATLQSNEAVEGGIKHMSFYWEQWGSESEHILNPVIYIKTGNNEPVQKASVEYTPAGSPVAANRMLIGINNIQSNSQLIIRNESHKSDGSRVNGQGRIILDEIHITPYLLYTTKEAELDLRNASTYTNADLINNIESGSIVYSLENNDEEASIDPASGEVTGIKAGEVTVKATWSEGAYTTYTLNIIAATETEASYDDAIVRIGLGDQVPENKLNITDGYEEELASESKSIAYISSNSAAVSYNAGVWTINGVGQTTITASLPATANFTAAEASFILQVTDNSTDVQVEAFSNVEKGNAAAHAGQLWNGDVYDWRVSSCGGVRKNEDKFASDQEREGIWMGTPDDNSNYSSLTVEGGTEGGIKHIWFFCEQPYNTGETDYTLKPVVYLNEATAANKVGEVEVVGTSGATSIAANRTLFGSSNVTKSNSVLIIRNESYQTDGGARPGNNRGRILLDEIHITPWLLFTDKAERVLRIGETTKNESLINTIGEAASFESSDPNVASVAGDGTVTAKASGKATITAKYQWNENEIVSTWYDVEVIPANCETFSNEATASNYASDIESAAGDKATWYARLAGIKAGDFEANVAFIRAPRQGEDKEAYLESSSIEGGIASMTFDWNLVAGEANTNWDIRILINGREVKQLGNDDLAEASNNKMENFAQIAIDGINEPDNFIIRFENHSTVNGTYTSGNKGRFVIDNITWTNYSGMKTFNESGNNDGWARANADETRNLKIERSPLVANVYNTLCMPFALEKSALGEGVKVQYMSNANRNGDELSIEFTELTSDVLLAGVPYLVMPTSAIDLSGEYSDKVIAEKASKNEFNGVKLQGTFSPVAVSANDYSTLFVGTPNAAGENLFYPSVDSQLRGLRAHFKIDFEDNETPAPYRRTYFVVDQNKVATDIESIQNSEISIQKVIRDGQLIIIRDGKEYNAQGMRIE